MQYKNPIIRILCISGWLTLPINPDKWSYTVLHRTNNIWCRSQWPRGLRRRSAAALLLRLWVRIPPGAWMLSVVSVVCCQVEVSATGWSLVQRSPTDCGCVVVCDLETSSRMRRLWPALGCCAIKKKNYIWWRINLRSAPLRIFSRRHGILFTLCLQFLKCVICFVHVTWGVDQEYPLWKRSCFYATLTVLGCNKLYELQCLW